MHFDDRLATVLQSPAEGELAARTQYRQLVDLLGTAPFEADSQAIADGYARLDRLSRRISTKDRAAMVRQAGSRLRNPGLALFLSRGEPAVAAATMATAQLDDDSWLALIPKLPIGARGFLRNREHSSRVAALLARLGVQDMVLPGPEGSVAYDMTADALELTEQAPPARTGEDIGSLVRRIEAFRQSRSQTASSGRAQPSRHPRLPLGDRDRASEPYVVRAMDFATDADGVVVWADPGVAPMLHGMSLLNGRAGSAEMLSQDTLERVRKRQPIVGARMRLIGANAIAGDWRLDAAPSFVKPGGAFTGYAGRLRRDAPVRTPETQADRLRQTLHELRTPANAIQGFAEVIQQQIFGPAPNEYRALAAEIAGDAARMLAGFEEIDRYARLGSGDLAPEAGESDLYAIASSSLRQIEPVLQSRNASFVLDASNGAFPIGLDSTDAERLVWRIAAALAGALGAGEKGTCSLDRVSDDAVLVWHLPKSIAAQDEIFAATVAPGARSLTASMFGSAFALRLARAEAEASGGLLVREGDELILKLPLLTDQSAPNSERSEA